MFLSKTKTKTKRTPEPFGKVSWLQFLPAAHTAFTDH
jgi:hypothetical protein